MKQIDVTDKKEQALGIRPVEAYLSRDLLLVMGSENEVEELCPDMEKLKALEGLIQGVTAKGIKYDCVSRMFAPKLNVFFFL